MKFRSALLKLDIILQVLICQYARKYMWNDTDTCLKWQL